MERKAEERKALGQIYQESLRDEEIGKKLARLRKRLKDQERPGVGNKVVICQRRNHEKRRATAAQAAKGHQEGHYLRIRGRISKPCPETWAHPGLYKEDQEREGKIVQGLIG
jgi:hypothetical protein